MLLFGVLDSGGLSMFFFGVLRFDELSMFSFGVLRSDELSTFFFDVLRSEGLVTLLFGALKSGWDKMLLLIPGSSPSSSPGCVVSVETTFVSAGFGSSSP